MNQISESHIFKFGSEDNEILLNISNNKNYLLINIQDNRFFPPRYYEIFSTFNFLKGQNEIFTYFNSTYNFVKYLETCNKNKKLTLQIDNQENAFIIISNSSKGKEQIIEVPKMEKNAYLNTQFNPNNLLEDDNSDLNIKLESYEEEILNLKSQIKEIKDQHLIYEKQINELLKNQNFQIENSINENFQSIKPNKYQNRLLNKNKNLNNINNLKNINDKINNLFNNNKDNIIITSSKKKITESQILKPSEISLIQNFIKPDSSIKFTQLFSTKINGDDTSNFHKLCDDKFPTLTIIKTKSGFRFGGYTTIPWKSDSLVFYKDNLAFLFSLDKKKKYYPENPDEAICCISGCGPCFGASDLTIRNECTKNFNSFCQSPQTYIMDKMEISGGVEKFCVDCYEVYLVEFE